MSQEMQRNYLTPKLVAIALGIDVFLVLFAALTAFGLQWVHPGLALGGGAALIVICVLAAGAARKRLAFAVALGWLVQVVLVACGVLLLFRDVMEGVTFLVMALGSLILWVWCLWRGGKTDREPAPI